MKAYFLRRLMLVPFTFAVITFMVYAILRVVPGGPIEQAETALKLAAMQGEGGGSGGGSLGADGDLQLDEEALGDLERYYALDRSIPVGYLQWLGAWPRERRTRVQARTLERHPEAFGALLSLEERRGALAAELDAALAAAGWIATDRGLYAPLDEAERDAVAPASMWDEARALQARGFGKRDELLALLDRHDLSYRQGTYFQLVPEPRDPDEEALFAEAARIRPALALAAIKGDEIRERYGFEATEGGRVYRIDRHFSGILQLDFGQSYTRGEPVLALIGSKLEISAQFGIIGYLLTWIVCVPLGIAKAIRHRTSFDALSSVLVFLGYAMPGFVLAMLLLTSVAANVDWLPLGGYKPDDIEQMGALEALVGRIRHMLIPIAAYMVGSFATMTMLMKNSLLENLASDYVRTAFAKGLSEKRVIFVHALRNSLIPITAGIGHAIGILFAGSFLIEKTCNIDGLGLLGFEALLLRDYPIIMGTLVIGVVIQVFGNILSDLVWAAIDPRIRFSGRGA